MTFANPGWLWLMALAIPLVLFHLRMRRKVRVVVPSLLLFDPATLAGAPPRAAGVLPRDLLGLLLEIAALACLSVGAAGPETEGPAAGSRPLAIVLDASASTMAGGRFEEERALARRTLEGVGPETPVTILLAAGEPRVLATAAEPRDRSEAALASAAPRMAGSGGLAAAADLAARSGAEVLVLTDGCDRDAPALAARSDVRVVSVGVPERNRALVGLALDLRRDGRHSLFVRILGEDGKVREEDRSAALRDGATGTVRVGLDPPGPPDALAADDAVEIGLHPPAPVRVAVLVQGGRPDPYLTAALEACGGALDAAGSVALDPAALANLASSPDVLVLSGGVADPGLVPALVFGAGQGAVQEAPAVQAGDRLHPVMRGVDPAELIVTRGRVVPALAGDAVLLQAPAGPLAVAGTREGRRRVLIGFDPRESTLPLSGSWPVLLRNALLWLAGEPAPLLLPEGGPRPPGALLDAAESDLSPRVPRNAGAAPLPSRPARGAGPRPLGARFSLAAAGCLLLEALLFAVAAGAAAGPRDSFAAAAPGS